MELTNHIFTVINFLGICVLFYLFFILNKKIDIIVSKIKNIGFDLDQININEQKLYKSITDLRQDVEKLKAKRK